MTENEIVPIETRGITKADVDRVKDIPKMLDLFFRSVLKEGTDYGIIPGTSKPSLYKPGAELLQFLFKFRSKSEIVSKIEITDPEKPYFEYIVETMIISQTGEELGKAAGSANTRETKHAFRRDIAGKKIPTPPNDVYTLANTVLKMADKRSFVGAILKVTGASRIFTQDLEDMDTGQSTPKHEAHKESPKTEPSKQQTKESPKTEPKKESTPQKITSEIQGKLINLMAQDSFRADYVDFFLTTQKKMTISDLTIDEGIELVGKIEKHWSEESKELKFREFLNKNLKQ